MIDTLALTGNLSWLKAFLLPLLTLSDSLWETGIAFSFRDFPLRISISAFLSIKPPLITVLLPLPELIPGAHPCFSFTFCQKRNEKKERER